MGYEEEKSNKVLLIANTKRKEEFLSKTQIKQQMDGQGKFPNLYQVQINGEYFQIYSPFELDEIENLRKNQLIQDCNILKNKFPIRLLKHDIETFRIQQEEPSMRFSAIVVICTSQELVNIWPTIIQMFTNVSSSEQWIDKTMIIITDLNNYSQITQWNNLEKQKLKQNNFLFQLSQSTIEELFKKKINKSKWVEIKPTYSIDELEMPDEIKQIDKLLQEQKKKLASEEKKILYLKISLATSFIFMIIKLVEPYFCPSINIIEKIHIIQNYAHQIYTDFTTKIITGVGIIAFPQVNEPLAFIWKLLASELKKYFPTYIGLYPLGILLLVLALTIIQSAYVIGPLLAIQIGIFKFLSHPTKEKLEQKIKENEKIKQNNLNKTQSKNKCQSVDIRIRETQFHLDECIKREVDLRETHKKEIQAQKDQHYDECIKREVDLRETHKKEIQALKDQHQAELTNLKNKIAELEENQRKWFWQRWYFS